MQIDRKQLLQLLAWIGLAILILVAAITHLDAFFNLLGKILGALKPFAIGFAIAYILSPLVATVTKVTKLKRGGSIATVYLGILLLISLFGNMVVPSIIEGSVEIANEIPSQVVTFNNSLNELQISNPEIEAYITKTISSVQDQLTGWANDIITYLTNFVKGLTSAVMTFIFGLVVSIYALIDQAKFLKLSRKISIAFLGDEKAMKFFDFMNTVNLIFSSFISGLIVDALIVGVLAFIGLSLLGVNYAVIFAIIICITNVIPYIGPFLGAIPAVAITLLYNPILALWVLLFIIVLQQIDANIIGPRVMGNYIGLEAIWIILAIALGGALMGMLGMILSIPVAAIIKILVGRVLDDKFNRRNSKIKI